VAEFAYRGLAFVDCLERIEFGVSWASAGSVLSGLPGPLKFSSAELIIVTDYP